VEYAIAPQHNAAIARFGELTTNAGTHRLPVASPGVRTAVDVAAVLENVASGMPLGVLTPFASYGVALGTRIAPMIQRGGQQVVVLPARPLVIADPEGEALSFHATARDNFLRTRPLPTASIVQLLRTGLGGEKQVHETWRAVIKANGTAPIVEWMAQRMQAVHSDVMTVSTPIIRSSMDTVTQAFTTARDLVREARVQSQALFTQFGVALVIHGDVFRDITEANKVRDAISRYVQSWARDPAMSYLFLLVKVYDHGQTLNEPQSSGIARRNLGKLVQELQAALSLSGGVLVFQNAGNWMLGYMHSGADVVSFRVTGSPKIDTPAAGRQKGPTEVPKLLMPRALIEVPPGEVQRTFAETGAFRKPDCVTCQQYWQFESPTDQRVYCARQRTGVLVELAILYRNAGLDTGLPLAEALDSLTSEARIKQELLDLFNEP
jgi:hypothetical protein